MVGNSGLNPASNGAGFSYLFFSWGVLGIKKGVYLWGQTNTHNMRIKQVFRKSSSTIVSQWISRNRQAIGVSNREAMCDCTVTEVSHGLFAFSWAGVSGSVECGDRVKVSTLKIN